MPENQDETYPSIRDVDQRAVDDYFSSQQFQQRMVFDHHSDAKIGRGLSSLLAGVIGLSAITFAFGTALPIGMRITMELVPNPPEFIVMMIIVQTMLFPAMIAFSFATITPMFWYGSVVLRFLFAAAAVVPGYFGFMIAILLADVSGPSDMWTQVSVVLFANFVATALVAVVVQMWSPWTMTHARTSDEPLPPLGTRTMIELTGIAAIGFAIFMAIDVTEVIVGIFFFVAFGVLASVGVISALIIYWRALKRNTLALILGGLFLFGAAFFVNGFVASMQYGWNVLSTELLLISLASLYGFALLCGVGWLCLRWLRFCGWNCVNQKLEQQVIDGLIDC